MQAVLLVGVLLMVVGKKDGATERLTGRARDNRLVHFVPGEHPVRPGDMVEVVQRGDHLVDRHARTSRTRPARHWLQRQSSGRDCVPGSGRWMPVSPRRAR